MQIVMHQGKKTVNKNAVFFVWGGGLFFFFFFYLILNDANKNKFMKMSVYKGKVQPFFSEIPSVGNNV